MTNKAALDNPIENRVNKKIDTLQATPSSNLIETFLKNSTVKIQNDFARIICPTRFHAQKIEEKTNEVLKFLKVKSIEVNISPTPRPITPNALQTSTISDQLPLAMPPKRNHLLNQVPRPTPPTPVISKCNELQYGLLKNWAERINHGIPSQVVWIFGESGSGKTWLAKQLNTGVHSNKHIEQTSIQNIFQEWRKSLETHDISFKRKYRKETDLLVLEHLDELSSKPKTKDEISIIVQSILDRGGHIVVSSSLSPPQLRESLPPELYSRLLSGLTIETQKADATFKSKLWEEVSKNFRLKNILIGDSDRQMILQNSPCNLRKLNAYFMNLAQKAALAGSLSSKDINDVQNIFHYKTNIVQGKLSPNEHVSKIAQLCGTSASAIMGNSKRNEIVTARRFCILSLNMHLGLSNSCIAQLLEKDASSVSRSLSAVTKRIATDESFNKQWEWIVDNLKLKNN